MPEPLSDAYLKEIQDRVTAVPKGPWKVEPNDYGIPDSVGPVAFIQTWADSQLLPTVEFIGHARTDLPALIGEVARLKDRIRVLESTAPRCENVSRHQRACDLPLGHDGDHQRTDRHVGLVRWPAAEVERDGC